VPYPAEMTGSRKNMIQMGEAWSLRFSAQMQFCSMGYTSSVCTLRQAAANSPMPSRMVKASSPQLWARVP